MLSCSVIGSGGLGLHPFVIRAVMVFVSVCMLLARKPFSPCISIGLSPVWLIMSILIDRLPLADDTRTATFSFVGGWMVVGSGV